MNAHVLCVAGTGDRANIAKSAAVAFQILGWDSQYVGDIEQDIDPFFDIDFQRYISRIWGNRLGMLVVCIFSSEEGPLKFLTSTARTMRGRLKGELRIVALAAPGIQPAAEESVDYAGRDLQSLLDWSERQYSTIA
jgi:hypothetical protein